MKRVAAVVGGAAWIILVVWVVSTSLGAAREAAVDGDIPGPSDIRVVAVWISSAVFSLPGVGFIVYGVKRRRGEL